MYWNVWSKWTNIDNISWWFYPLCHKSYACMIHCSVNVKQLPKTLLKLVTPTKIHSNAQNLHVVYVVKKHRSNFHLLMFDLYSRDLRCSIIQVLFLYWWFHWSISMTNCVVWKSFSLQLTHVGFNITKYIKEHWDNVCAFFNTEQMSYLICFVCTGQKARSRERAWEEFFDRITHTLRTSH